MPRRRLRAIPGSPPPGACPCNAAIQPDVIRCIPPEEGGNSAICLDDGTWEPRFCPDGGTCLPLSDGTGLCVPGG